MSALLRVREVQLFERQVELRMPFRFGVVTLTAAPQLFARTRIVDQRGQEAWGMAAELLAPKWFDKDLALSNEQNFDQLRRSTAIARDLYLSETRLESPFGLYAHYYAQGIALGRARSLNPLVMAFGSALLDRAILDAACRLYRVSFYNAVRHNLPGLAAAPLAPDLDESDVGGLLMRLLPRDSIHARHTVGLVDPIVAADQPPGTRLDDGLPETLEEVVAHYGCRYFKLKVAGDIAADLDRLCRIAAVLDRGAEQYWASLDGNEQFADAESFAALWHGIAAEPRLERLRDSILFIEQPIQRKAALASDVSAISALRPVIVNESDGEIDAFVQARACGYRGISSKTCKGVYRSLLNAARAGRWNREANAARYFLSGEDLTTQAGVCVQQDLALVSLLGLEHVERNGHHYVNGMQGVAEHEQREFATVHADLYDDSSGVTRLKIANGCIALGSLACPGYAVAAEPD